MLHLVENLQFKANIEFVSKISPCFKSEDYPPKDDFVMSIDQNGKVISRYGDDTWDFTSFGSKTKFHFKNYDKANKEMFKQLMFYVTYSCLFPGKYNSLTPWYVSFQNIFKTCSKHEINASDLNRFPRVIEEIAEFWAKNSPSYFQATVSFLNSVLKIQDQIGFALLNEKSIALFKQFDPSYEEGQTAYIPNRIWTAYIQHLDSVFDDFEFYQDKLEGLYHYLVKTTISNEEKGICIQNSSPFNHHRAKNKVFYDGTLETYLKAHGLMSLFEKYVERPELERFKEYTSDQPGALLNNFSRTCYLYILYYSIMRKSEALSLRTDCLQIENDERLGNFYLLVGETTKTDPDSDAHWVVPKRVERAVKIAKILLDWKLQYVSVSDEPPHLFQNLMVWHKSRRVSKPSSFASFGNTITIKAYFFFKIEQYRITQEDYDEALALTPSLVKKNWFKVGATWQFSYHQFRRTLAIHFALNKISASSTQLQMKHGTREQQFHYQNNAGRLRLNHGAEQEIVNEYYAEMARNITSTVYGEAILPHAKSPVKQEVVCFIEEGDMNKLLKAQKNGSIGYRKNILGGCVKQGVCEYGGFDSIAHCAGGDGGNPCSDLIIDGAREQEFKDDKAEYEIQMDDVPKDSPRFMALNAEVRGYETVLDIIEKKKG
jgi:integrase